MGAGGPLGNPQGQAPSASANILNKYSQPTVGGLGAIAATPYAQPASEGFSPVGFAGTTGTPYRLGETPPPPPMQPPMSTAQNPIGFFGADGSYSGVSTPYRLGETPPPPPPRGTPNTPGYFSGAPLTPEDAARYAQVQAQTYRDTGGLAGTPPQGPVQGQPPAVGRDSSEARYFAARAPMPAAPNSQQLRPEDPRMQAMRNIQRLFPQMFGRRGR